MPRIRAATIAQHKAQTRAAILDAAEEALAGLDFGAVSLGVIADMASIPRSTVYDYFASREAIVAALIEERVPPLVNDWMALLSGTTPLERIESFFFATFTMAAEHPKLTSALLGAGRRIPRDQHDEFVPIAFTITEQIRTLVDQGIEHGDFYADDPESMAAAVTDLLAGGIDDIVGRDRPKLKFAVVTETRLRMLRCGVAVCTGPSA